MTEPRAITPTRKAATEGLLYAIHLVTYFGWAPPSPDDGQLNLGTTLNLAAGKTAVVAGQAAYDVNALMGHLLAEHLRASAPRDWHGLVDWECQPGRTADDVTIALQGAATA